ncbi:MAG: hypothetical protein FWH40_07675 [Coriobacteriia bacterium]|nr:hypothetical protein [Coriobacteriia bacterium]
MKIIESCQPVKGKAQVPRYKKPVSLVLALLAVLTILPLNACSNEQADESDALTSTPDFRATGDLLRVGNTTYIALNFLQYNSTSIYYAQIVRINEDTGAQAEVIYTSKGGLNTAPFIMLLYGQGGSVYFLETDWKPGSMSLFYSYHAGFFNPRLKSINVEKPSLEVKVLPIHLEAEQPIPADFKEAYVSWREGLEWRELSFSLDLVFSHIYDLTLGSRFVYCVFASGYDFDHVFILRLNATSGAVDWFEGPPLRYEEFWLGCRFLDGSIYFSYTDFSLDDQYNYYRFDFNDLNSEPEALLVLPASCLVDNRIIADETLYCEVDDLNGNDGYPSYSLYSLDLHTKEGGEFKQLPYIVSFDIYEDRLYYVNSDLGLRSCLLDGSDDQHLIAGDESLSIEEFYVFGDWVYYKSAMSWYYMRLDAEAFPIDPIK